MYFIFDADNRLDYKFVEEMVKSYQDGYDYVIGYRNSTNFTHNRITIASGLLFSFLNDLGNVRKMKNNKPVTTSGTGYFISNSIIDKYNSFPFYTLTEDYEFSVNSTINNFSSFYNKKAIFYDEQPIDRKTTFIQRIRWCKGYQQVRKKYKQALKLKKHDKHALDEYYGVSYYISLIFCYALLILTSIVGIIYNTILKNNIIYDLTVLIALIGVLFIALELISFVLMRNLKEKKRFRDYIKALIYFPIYLSKFLPIYFKARFSNVEWKEIKHKGQ